MIDTKDMTVGRPWKLLLGFSLPLMLGNVFQLLYTVVDTMIVGKVLGDVAVASLGVVHWPVFMMFGFLQGLLQGFSVVMAKCFGAGDYKGLRWSVANSAYLALFVAVIFTGVGQAIVRPVLILMQTPSKAIGLSSTYLRILYAGIPITMAYNLLAVMLRALGNSKTPLRAMTIASLCNIALDVLFVFAFRWGIAGAAFATLISEVLATVFCYARLRHIDVLKFEAGEHILNIKLCLKELRLGLPLGLQNIITAVGGIVVQSVVNSFGVIFMAGFTAANKLYGILEIAASSYGYAMSTYAGQNSGAGLYARVRKGLRSSIVIGIITACIMSGIMVIFGEWILGCFIDGTDSILIGYQFLTVLAVFFPLLYILYIVRSCLQGLGNTIIPMVSSIAQLVMRTGCVLLLTQIIGYAGVFYGEVLAWVGAISILLIFYYRWTVCLKTM